jgi:hypothetical protein
LDQFLVTNTNLAGTLLIDDNREGWRRRKSSGFWAELRLDGPSAANDIAPSKVKSRWQGD